MQSKTEAQNPRTVQPQNQKDDAAAQREGAAGRKGAGHPQKEIEQASRENAETHKPNEAQKIAQNPSNQGPGRERELDYAERGPVEGKPLPEKKPEDDKYHITR